MIYKTYSIWIQRNTTKEKNPTEGDWEGFIWEEFYPQQHRYWDSWALCIDESSPKEVFELAKMEIELKGCKELKRKMNKSIAEILKLDWRNNRN
jgi:hypothetical protein